VTFLDVIATRRDGGVHREEDLRLLADGSADGSIPDYQLSAWLMAAFLNPLSDQETAWLTMAMAQSGDRIDLTGLPKPWVDKHSTGGVGDKTTLVLLPILAACGLTVVKMSGRGLGITGGTVDKLSSIPGFRLDLSPEEMKAQASRIGLALTGQTPDLAPADKTLYALRDVTATVASIPLIVSSILSKKIAGGAETIVIDVKCGSGAFMTDLKEATHLSRLLVSTGDLCGLKVKTSISDMNQPLGSAVGNSLEVAEALAVLSGEAFAPPTTRFRELCLHYAAETLAASGKCLSESEGRMAAERALDTGAALNKAYEWFKAQGGDADRLPEAHVVAPLSGEGGWVQEVDAEAVGRAVIELGGGRSRKEDVIDLSVGVKLHVQVGQQVGSGGLLAEVHAASDDDAEQALASLKAAIRIGPNPIPEPPLFLG